MRNILSPLLVLLAFSQIFCQKAPVNPTSTKPPFVLGVIDEIDSKLLAEKRILNIYLPEGYKENGKEKYPVIYLLDGGADEDFIHVAGIVQFNNFSWIDRVPRSIIVGIANTDRKRDFTYPSTIAEDKKLVPGSGKSSNFINFLETELQPYIAKNYRAGKDKTLIGQSLGGLLATEILLKRPQLFDKYIIISPSLWWDNASLFDIKSPLFEAKFDKQTDVYIGVGDEGFAPVTTTHNMQAEATTLFDKLSQNESGHVKVYYDYLPQEDHATISHQAIFNAFRMLYPQNTKK
ncbi:MAG: alpha/beta hydrolase-fold protein [Saprospiraceae bacterium]